MASHSTFSWPWGGASAHARGVLGYRMIRLARQRLFVCAAVLLAAAACTDDPVTPVPAVRSVSVSPKNASVLLGRTVAVTATVSVDGGASDEVVWSTSNAAVALVSEDGVVTGNQLGDVTITATSTFDAAKKDVASISVVLGEPATVAIQSVNRSGTAFPVDPSAVTGMIDVRLNVSPGDQLLTRIDLLVDNVVVATQSFESPAFSFASLIAPTISGAPFVATLSFSTAAFNAQTGVPLFLNAAHTLTARVSAIGGVTATAGLPLTFSNPNAMIALVSGSGAQASDASGRMWVSGDLTVTARPVIYTAGTVTLAAAIISYPGLQNKTAGANGVVSWSSSVLVANGGSGGYSNNGGVDAVAPVVVSSILSNGAAGPAGQLANAAAVAVRLDNRAPHPGILTLTSQSAATACCSGGWVGNGYLFASGHAPSPGDGEGLDGAGIGPSGVTYHVGNPALTNEQIVAASPVTGSATLAPSTFSNAYTVVARVSDRVANISLVRLSPSTLSPTTTFGVDKSAPTFSFAVGSVADGAVNPGALIFLTSAVDDASGFAPLPVVHRILGNFATTLCFLGGPNCSPVLGGFVIGVASVDGFYFTYEAFVRDQAGNASPTLTRSVLFDQQAPQVTAMLAPPLFAAPTLTQFSVSAADNVDLKSAEHRLDFPGASGPLASLPFLPPAALSTFGAPLITAQSVFVSIPFVRSLEQTTTANVPTGTLQATEGTRFRITDQAGNSASQSALFSGGSVPPGSSATLRSVQAFRISAPVVPVALCSGTICGAVPQTIQISAEASGPDGTFNNPFSNVYFYWVDSSGLTRLIGSTSASEVTNAGGVRRWTWTVNFSAPGVPSQAAVQIFAIGVDPDGDGLRTRALATVNIIEGG